MPITTQTTIKCDRCGVSEQQEGAHYLIPAAWFRVDFTERRSGELVSNGLVFCGDCAEAVKRLITRKKEVLNVGTEG